MQPDATAPFCQNVNLFGCLIRTGATKYRLAYRFSSDGGGDVLAEVPFTNVEWWWHPLVGRPSMLWPTPMGGTPCRPLA
jgi:hypothetical protein